MTWLRYFSAATLYRDTAGIFFFKKLNNRFRSTFLEVFFVLSYMKQFLLVLKNFAYLLCCVLATTAEPLFPVYSLPAAMFPLD